MKRYTICYSILTLLLINFSIINCSKKAGDQGNHEREIKIYFEDVCEEYKYILKLSMNLHLTKRESDFSSIYSTTISKYLKYKKIDNINESEILKESSIDSKDCNEINEIKKYVALDRTQIQKEILFIFMQELDPHSFFLYNRDGENLDNWKYGNDLGIGIYLDLPLAYIYGKPFNEFVVNQIASDSPAVAKIYEGDRVLAVNDKPISSLQHKEFIKEFTLTPVKLHIARGGNLLPPIVLDKKKNNSLSIKYKNYGDFDYLRLRIFHSGASDLLSKYFKKSSLKKGLILDLRSNPGGSFDEALKIADMLVSTSLVVLTEARADTNEFMISNSIKPKNEYYAIDYSTKLEIPIIVLMNHKSASASELLAGYLQRTGAAIIMGDRSFGKGVVQHIFKIEDQQLDGELRITTERYILPDGQNIQKVGIIPDIRVENNELIDWMQRYKAKNSIDGIETIFREEDYGNRTVSRKDLTVNYSPKFQPKFQIDDIKSKLKQFTPTHPIHNPNNSDDYELDLAKQYMAEYIKLKAN